MAFHMDYELLEKTVKLLIQDQSLHICIHDASGILYSTPSMALSGHYKIHSSSFCYGAKSTACGLRFCLKCKSFSILKAMKEKRMYVGQCYLGITEIIQPVFWNNKLVCVIYLGNLMMKNQRTDVINRIKKACSLTRVNEALLLEKLETTCLIDQKRLEEYKEIVNVLYHQILLILAQPTTNKINKKASPDLPITSESHHWVIDSIHNYVAAYYNRDIRLSDLATLYFLNPQYLCRLFRKETGMNFTEYIHEVRIGHAKHLLTISEDTIVNIALEVGFNNVSYFNRIFKKYTKLIPSEYRKRYSSHSIPIDS